MPTLRAPLFEMQIRAPDTCKIPYDFVCSLTCWCETAGTKGCQMSVLTHVGRISQSCSMQGMHSSTGCEWLAVHQTKRGIDSRLLTATFQHTFLIRDLQVTKRANLPTRYICGFRRGGCIMTLSSTHGLQRYLTGWDGTGPDP